MFKLPELKYKPEELEPYIDAETMKIHHGKHHQAYVDNLNKAIEKHTDLQEMSIEDLMKNINSLPEDVKAAIRNNGGGHANHSLFWESMSPSGGGTPDEELLSNIEHTFESFDSFKSQFADAGMKQFGSGWAWLVLSDGNLEIISTPNQDSPITQGKTPLLGCDVWEHAYYLKYQNRRADYLEAWWNIVDWNEVSKRLNK